MTRKDGNMIVINVAWGIYFALWAAAHMRLLFSFVGVYFLIELLLVFQNLVLMFFFIIRKPSKSTSWNLLDVTWATVGGFGMTLCWSTNQFTPHPIGILLQIAGAVLTVYASLSLGRSWGVIPANREIQTNGLYRFIRHPIYASWQIFFLGYLINQPSYYNIAITLVCFLCQIMRILSEEKLLSRDGQYLQYCASVRWRLLPYVF